MRNVFGAIGRWVSNGWHWGLDYAYVGYWQVHDAVIRENVAAYQRGRDDRPAIILLPGIYERWQFMKPLADMLDEEGYRLHIIEDMGYNRRPIEAMAGVVEGYIRQHRLHNYIVVAHSKGGLIGKFLLMRDKHRRCRGMVAINTPFAGSIYARLSLLRTLRMFAPKSKILQFLAGDRAVNARIVSVYGQFDPHIPGGSKLEGATNIQTSQKGHFKPIASEETKRAVRDAVHKFAA